MKLETEIAGLKLKNPLMPASGPLVGDDKKMLYLETLGVGCMVTKTISVRGAEVPRPCIFGKGNRIMNAELWSEHPLENWVENFLPKLKKDSKLPLIISAGYTKDDMTILIPALDKFADAFEISTHYVGKDLDNIRNTVREIRKYTKKPLFMKISPHIPDVVAFANAIKEEGATGIVAINSLGPTMEIDVQSKSILMGNSEGYMWSSGPAIKPVALAIVHKIKEAIPELIVIGVGGVESAKDVLEFLLAGADGVQMLSAAMLKGKDLYEKIINDLPIELKKYGFDSINEVKKAKLAKNKIIFEPKYPIINGHKCVTCGLCEKICPYFAMEHTNESNKKIYFANEKECFGCGLCQSKCPVNAISNVY